MLDKPFSQACENNKGPILEHLQRWFADVDEVLEIGSGTGQHAVCFAGNMPWLQWQPSDQADYLPGVGAWRAEAGLSNLGEPLELDVRGEWPTRSFPAVFTANTLHIMHWPVVEALFGGLQELLSKPAKLVVYGPFNYSGKFTSESNARFDASLKARDSGMGIRDQEAVVSLAASIGLTLVEDQPMPANNRLLQFVSGEA